MTYIYHYMYINNDVTLYKFCIIYGIVANTSQMISPLLQGWVRIMTLCVLSKLMTEKV